MTKAALAWLTAPVLAVAACSSTNDDASDSDEEAYPALSGGTAPAAGDTTGKSSPGTGGNQPAEPAATGGQLPTSTGGELNSSDIAVEACTGLQVTPQMLADEEEEPCVQDEYESEPMPVDLFIMMDRSVSMLETVPGADMTRWEGVRKAVRAFVTDPQVAERDIRMGINFFNQTGGFVPEVDCNITNYASPGTLGVEMGSVADADHAQAILDAIDAVTPGGQTPTMPALQGALQYAKQFNANHGSGRAMVVALVTDGLPTQCQDPLSVPDVAEAAAQAYATDPPVRTFVVGIGPAARNLDQIAAKGGTQKAYHIEQGDAAAQFADALKNITLSSLTCRFGLPDAPDANRQLNLDEVRIRYTPDTSVPDVLEEVPALHSFADCFGSQKGGWYYDNPDSPTMIQVCPCTCSRFRTGFVDIQYGCVPLPL